jgi:hypothetical protein
LLVWNILLTDVNLALLLLLIADGAALCEQLEGLNA